MSLFSRVFSTGKVISKRISSLCRVARDRPQCQRTFSRAVANERGGGEPSVRAVDAGGVGEGVCGKVVKQLIVKFKKQNFLK